MEAVFIPFIIAALLAPPFMSARIAKNFGRPYWTWFAIGCVLPIIANFIILFLPDKSKAE